MNQMSVCQSSVSDTLTFRNKSTYRYKAELSHQVSHPRYGPGKPYHTKSADVPQQSASWAT